MTNENVYAALLKKIRDVQASGGGVSDYSDLTNKPQINGVILNGNKTPGELELINYSTKEQLIGRWIDGNLLYEKTLNFGSLPNAGTKSFPHGISGIDIVWIYDGYISDGNVFYNLDMPKITRNTPASLKPYDWKTYVNKTEISIETAEDKHAMSAIITLRYTKTPT